jgi:hypothetical protein
MDERRRFGGHRILLVQDPVHITTGPRLPGVCKPTVRIQGTQVAGPRWYNFSIQIVRMPSTCQVHSEPSLVFPGPHLRRTPRFEDRHGYSAVVCLHQPGISGSRLAIVIRKSFNPNLGVCDNWAFLALSLSVQQSRPHAAEEARA